MEGGEAERGGGKDGGKVERKDDVRVRMRMTIRVVTRARIVMMGKVEGEGRGKG